MTVNELIGHLTAFSAQSPENGSAQIMLNYDGDVCMAFGSAKDLRGLVGEHCLVFFPNMTGNRVIIREMGKQ